VLVTEDDASGGDASGGDTSGIDNGSTDSGAGGSGTNSSTTDSQPDNTNGDSGSVDSGGGGCAPGTTCDNTNGDTGNTNPPTNNYQPDNTNWDSGSGGGGGCAAGTTCDNTNTDNNWNTGNTNQPNSGDNFGGGDDQCFSDPACKNERIKNDLRDLKRMRREAERAGADSLLSTIDSLSSQMEAATTQEEIDAVREQIWSVQKELETARMADEIKRREKDLARQEKQFAKDSEFLTEMLETVSEEWKTSIENHLEAEEKIMALQKQILDLMKNGAMWEDFEVFQWELEDLWYETGDFWEKFQDIKDQQWIGQMFNDVLANVKRFKELELPYMNENQKAKAEEMISVAETMATDGLTALQEGDMEKAKKIQFKLEEFGRKAEKFLGKPNPKFNELGFGEIDEDFNQFSEEWSYEKQLKLVEKILMANPTMIQQLVEGNKMLAERTFAILDRVPEGEQNDFLEKKANLGDIYEEVVEQDNSMAYLEEDVMGYNFYGDGLDGIIETLESYRDGGVTKGELVKEIAQHKDQSKENKYQDGIISFPDYDDNVWYFESVENMDFLKGKITPDGTYEFAGGDTISFNEVLRMTLEKFGYGSTNTSTSYSPAQGDWSEPYFATAENLDITLYPPGHLVTRGEMAKTMIEATIRTSEIHSDPSFGDLPTSDPHFNDIETLHDYGVLSGDGGNGQGLPTIRSNDTLNRAEFTKILDSGYKNFQIEMTNIEEFSDFLDYDNVIDIESSDWEVDFNEDNGGNNDTNFEEDNFGGDNWGTDGGQGMGGDYQPDDNYDYDNDLEDTSDELNDLLDNLMNNVFSALRN